MNFVFLRALFLSLPFTLGSISSESEQVSSSIDELMESFRSYVSLTAENSAAGLPVSDPSDRKYFIQKISSDLNLLDSFVIEGADELRKSAGNPKREAHVSGVAMYLVQAEFLSSKLQEIGDSLAQVKTLPGDEGETRRVVLRSLGQMRRARQKFFETGSALEAELPLAIDLIELGMNRPKDDSIIDVYGNFVAKETYLDNLNRMLTARDRVITETAPLVQFQV